VDGLLEAHRVLGYVGIVANGIAGLVMLGAWRWPALRRPAGWWLVGAAQVLILTQVVLGTLVVAFDETYRAVVPRFHMFYGFLIFITVGLLTQYRAQVRGRGRRELLYGLGGLFIMGLGIRAVLQVTG
jgi:hypothetical protein